MNDSSSLTLEWKQQDFSLALPSFRSTQEINEESKIYSSFGDTFDEHGYLLQNGGATSSMQSTGTFIGNYLVNNQNEPQGQN